MPRARTTTTTESAPSGSGSGGSSAAAAAAAASAVGPKTRVTRRSTSTTAGPIASSSSRASSSAARRSSRPSRAPRQSEAVGVPRPLAKGGEMRLEELDDSEEGEEEEEGLSGMLQNDTRMSLGGEASPPTEASFFFSTKSAPSQQPPVASSSSSSSQPRSGAAPVLERMRVDAVGETPVQNRNRDVRRAADAGALGHGQAPNTPYARRTGSDTAQPKRRRTSGLRDGTAVQPHAQVPDSELYRHCADLETIPRTRVLVGWILERQVGGIGPPAPLSPAPEPKDKGKGKKRRKLDVEMEERRRVREEAWREEDASWTPEHRRRLPRVREAAEGVLRSTLEDLARQKVDVNWIARPGREKKAPHEKPNPINVSNQKTWARMKALESKAQTELDGWLSERTSLDVEVARAEALEAEVERLRAAMESRKRGGRTPPRLVEVDAASVLSGVLPTSGASAIPASDADADALFLKALQGGPEREALELAQVEIGREQEESRRVAEGVGKKGRQSKGKKREKEDGGYDARWKEVEFNADLLRARTHVFSQLDALSTRYLSSSSARASAALRARAETGRIGSGAAAGGGGDGDSPSPSGKDPISRANLGQLLSGAVGGQEEVADGGGKDKDSTLDLLRAFGKAASR